MPPEGFAVSRTDWLLSRVGLEGVAEEAVNAELTLTVSPAEHALVEALSVTL